MKQEEKINVVEIADLKEYDKSCDSSTSVLISPPSFVIYIRT